MLFRSILFGARRRALVPLVFQAFNWQHGTFLGATLASETTAAATGAVGVVRRDPMANIPFIGYDAGAYFQHWLEIGARLAQPPRMFLVNWFRKDSGGRFLWPGFGENMRVLKWMLDRCDGRAGALETPVGWTPRPTDLELRDLPVAPTAVEAALRVDSEEWTDEIEKQGEWLDHLGATVPKALRLQHDLLESAVATAQGANSG